MRCDICGSCDTYVKEHVHEYMIKGKKIMFKAERKFCKKCDNLVYDSKLDNIATMKGIELYNQKYGVPKEKIIELRKKYNLSQELFSKIIGCAKKTLISYEKGSSIPNDNFMMTLKSLIANPNVIINIIEANKDEFTREEQDRIRRKIKNLGNNLKAFYSGNDGELSIFNGYTELNKNKIYNMILFFSDNGLPKTKLLKEMFYADFLYYKEIGASITGLEYAKINYGPVPDEYEEIINECVKNKFINYNIEFKNDYEIHNITSIKKFDKNAFDQNELVVLERVRDFFKKFKASEIVSFSHKEKAFTATEFYKNISYDYAFDINDFPSK